MVLRTVPTEAPGRLPPPPDPAEKAGALGKEARSKGSQGLNLVHCGPTVPPGLYVLPGVGQEKHPRKQIELN